MGNYVVNGDFNDNAVGWALIDFQDANWQPVPGCDGAPGAFFVNDTGGVVPETSQLVSGLLTSRTYTVSGCYRRGTENFTGPMFRVLVDDVELLVAEGSVADGWRRFSATFVATDADVLLRFQTQLSGDDAYHIDNVRICSGAVSCPWDCGKSIDGNVGIVDFLAVLAQWGQVGTSCDIDGGGVGITEFLELLANWGPCP